MAGVAVRLLGNVSRPNSSINECCQRSFPSADLVGKLVVFNVGGNRFRLIAYVDYAHKKLFVRSVLTHAQYSKEPWKTDPWF